MKRYNFDIDETTRKKIKFSKTCKKCNIKYFSKTGRCPACNNKSQMDQAEIDEIVKMVIAI